MTDLVLKSGLNWDNRGKEDDTIYPDLKTKIGETTGKTLYSYDGCYWFSTPDAAATAYSKLN